MSSINFDIRVNLIKYMKAETMILIDFSRSMEQVFNAIIELTENFSHPFNFAIISGLSDNPQQLVQLLKSQVISFNADIPEAVFDAIIQVAKCNQVGWSTSKTMAKNIVVFSDSFSQTQGFGRVGKNNIFF
ncbi:hypothetical protein HZS_7085 [Henneguya salminicola]|nr:hypothetical protein HZS_7085 [Henneguya salminicola]